MIEWFKKILARLRPDPMWERKIVVEDRGGAVVVTEEDGTESSVPWAELERVEIHTTDTGPFSADVWWVLTGTTGTCTYPAGATGEPEMLKMLQALEGFDDLVVVIAMGSVENARFVCWERA